MHENPTTRHNHVAAAGVAPRTRLTRGGGPATCLAVALAAASGAALAVDDLAILSDEFDNPSTLTEWKRINVVEGWHADQLETWSIDAATGRMTMIPYTSTWYQDWRGVLAFKEVTGDFVVTTEVDASGRGDTDPPGVLYSLGGIMVRAPRPDVTSPTTWTPGGENYIFLSLGSADVPGTFQYESKTTVNSVSNLIPSPGVGRAEIRIARIGQHFIELRREPGSGWSVTRRYDRPDLPPTLQVGLTVYTDWPNASALPPLEHNQTVILGGNPDLEARFDFVRYRRPVVPAALAGAAFSDETQVSATELLAFLGEAADAPSTQRLELDARYADGSLILDLLLGPTEPVTLHLGLQVGGQSVPLAAVPLPALPSPITLPPIPIPLPSLGPIAVSATYTDGSGATVGARIVVVDTP
ncbi:MAG: hypothetical protein H6983_00805 [Ectothiorhodospiraceae bacterium]|nr:hypothetical protein [Ectothiorhodospiraceae bacterium]